MMLYALLIVMTMLGAVASLSLKKACGTPGVMAIAKSGFFYVGGFLYFGSAIINIYLLKFLDYSVVLPFTSLTYVWSTILSALVFEEKISKQQIFGLICLICGAFLIVF